MTYFHRISLSLAYHQFHLLKRVIFIRERLGDWWLYSNNFLSIIFKHIVWNTCYGGFFFTWRVYVMLPWTLSKSFTLVTCLSFISIALLELFILELKLDLKRQMSLCTITFNQVGFVIGLILILNHGDIHHLCILIIHLSLLLYGVQSQLINTLIGVFIHVREPTFTWWHAFKCIFV